MLKFGNKGSTIIENLIALALLASVLTLLIGILLRSMSFSGTGRFVEASIIAEREMEETLFLKDYNNIEYNVGTKWRIKREVESIGDRRIISLSLFFKQSEYPEVTLKNIRLAIEDSL